MKQHIKFDRYVMFPAPANLDIKDLKDIDALYADGVIPCILHTDKPVERDGWYLFGLVGQQIVRINKTSDVSV